MFNRAAAMVEKYERENLPRGIDTIGGSWAIWIGIRGHFLVSNSAWRHVYGLASLILITSSGTGLRCYGDLAKCLDTQQASRQNAKYLEHINASRVHLESSKAQKPVAFYL